MGDSGGQWQNEGGEECVGVHTHGHTPALPRAHLCGRAHAAPDVCGNQRSVERLIREWLSLTCDC